MLAVAYSSVIVCCCLATVFPLVSFGSLVVHFPLPPKGKGTSSLSLCLPIFFPLSVSILSSLFVSLSPSFSLSLRLSLSFFLSLHLGLFLFRSLDLSLSSFSFFFCGALFFHTIFGLTYYIFFVMCSIIQIASVDHCFFLVASDLITSTCPSRHS